MADDRQRTCTWETAQHDHGNSQHEEGVAGNAPPYSLTMGNRGLHQDEIGTETVRSAMLREQGSEFGNPMLGNVIQPATWLPIKRCRGHGRIRTHDLEVHTEKQFALVIRV